MVFEIGNEYKIKEIRSIVGTPGRGGKWVKGYFEHNNEMYIFANTKSPGFGGQKYRNIWLTSSLFEWSGDNRSKATDKYIQMIMDPDQIIHLFTRDNKYRAGGELTYQGKVRALDLNDEIPVIILFRLIEADGSEKY